MNRVLVVCMLFFSVCTAIDQSKTKTEKPFDYERYGGKEHCLKSDFDGNGINDYVAPAGEGWITVFMNYGTNAEKKIE